MSVKKYRLVNEDEIKEIKTLAKKAMNRIGLSTNESNDKILETIDDYIEDTDFNNLDITEISFELGSLYGEQFVKKYDWSWYCIELDSVDYYGVVSKDLKVANLCHNYMNEILTKKRNNNFILTYNMIKNQYPKEWKFMFLH